jgi:hypothetical protein
MAVSNSQNNAVSRVNLAKAPFAIDLSSLSVVPRTSETASTRAPSKPAIAQSMIGAGHTAQSLRGIDTSKIDLFVMDDFSNRNVVVGRHGTTTVKASHGEVALRLASLNLKDKVTVGRLNLGVPGKDFTTDQAATDNINKVIDTIAKRQGKTRHSPDLDLSSVTINWSRGQAYEPNAAPDEQLTAAVKLLTSRGGSLVTTAGNAWYNSNAAYLPGVTIVDGSAEHIGSKASKNPAPWSGYANSGMGPYCNDLSRCAGIEARGARPTNNPAAILIAPSVATFQTDSTGNVKMRTVDPTTGKVEFVKFLDASKTTKSLSYVSSAPGMVGNRPSRLVTGEEAQQFSAWVDGAARRATISPTYPGGNLSKNPAMTADQRRNFDGMVKAESLKRFGPVAVMSLDALKAYVKFAPDSTGTADLNGIVPDGMKSKDVLLSVDQIVVEGRRPLGSAQLLKLDAQNKLTPMLLNTVASFGTSWGAPIAAGDIAAAKAPRLTASPSFAR